MLSRAQGARVLKVLGDCPSGTLRTCNPLRSCRAAVGARSSRTTPSTSKAESAPGGTGSGGRPHGPARGVVMDSSHQRLEAGRRSVSKLLTVGDAIRRVDPAALRAAALVKLPPMRSASRSCSPT